jgi:hypothetical protein
MSKKFLTNIDLGKNELQNAVLQQLAADPSSPVQGLVYYNTVDDKIKYYDGSVWVTVDVGTTGVTQSGTSGSTGRMKVSAGTDRSITDYTGGAGLVKSDINGVVSAATAGTDYVTGASTNTFTNKTFDANGTGNSITNIETADFAANVVDTDITLAANSDTRLASQKATKAYIDNSVQGLSWKSAVRVATTANGTLATAFANSQTIDGVTLVTGDRILLKDQSTGADNGIYTVNASGAPTRALDANAAAELVSATVYVSEGTANAETVWTQTVNAPITVGTTALVWAQVNGGAVPVATTTTQGKVELATQAEAEARTDTARATTPASLVNFPIKKIFTVGDGSSTTLTLTHSLNTLEVITQVRQASDNAIVECDIINATVNTVTLGFTVAPASNAIKAVVLG